MRLLFAPTFKSAVMAVTMACFSSLCATAYQQETGVSPVTQKKPRTGTVAVPEKAATVATPTRKMDCYLALHQDMAGTPFLNEMTDTAEDKAEICSSAKVEKLTRGDPL